MSDKVMAQLEAIQQAGQGSGQFPYNTTDPQVRSIEERRIEMWGRYGVDIQFSGFEPTLEQLAIIERVLGELQQRPADLRHVDQIIFEGGHEHRGGAAITCPQERFGSWVPLMAPSV